MAVKPEAFCHENCASPLDDDYHVYILMFPAREVEVVFDQTDLSGRNI